MPGLKGVISTVHKLFAMNYKNHFLLLNRFGFQDA